MSRAISRALPFGQLRGALLVAFARVEVLGVGALVLDERAGALLRLAVDVHDAGDRFVEEVEVVAHDEQRAAVRPQELEQPGARVGVEVVGGLVEQEQVAAAEEDAHELGAAPLTAGERAEVEVEAIRAQADAVGELAHLRLRGVPTGRLELLLRGAEALDVLGRGVLLERDPQLLGARQESSSPRPEKHVGEDGGVVGDGVAAGVLREVAGERRALDEPGPRPVGAAEHPQERGLAGAVAAHQADLLARAHLQRRTVDDPLSADLDHQATNGQHGKNSRKLRAGSIILAAARRSALLAWIDADADRRAPPPKPARWRGRIHLVAFLVSIPAGLALVLLSRGRLGPRRRRHLRRVARGPLRRQRHLPHRQLGAATCGPGCSAWTTR